MKVQFDLQGQTSSGCQRRLSVETAGDEVILRYHLGPPCDKTIEEIHLTKALARAIASAIMGAAAEL